jgi:predicted NAD-dependent protein-ADP-ribosyltransferase YbiA (DUF1768 family)
MERSIEEEDHEHAGRKDRESERMAQAPAIAKQLGRTRRRSEVRSWGRPIPKALQDPNQHILGPG